MTLTEHLTLLTLIGSSKLKRPKKINRENAQKYNNNRNQLLYYANQVRTK